MTVLRDYLLKPFYSIEEFLSAGHNNVDTLTFIFNLYYYFVCVYNLFFFSYHVLTNFM